MIFIGFRKCIYEKRIKFGCFLLNFVLVFNLFSYSLVFADSGLSAMPQKDPYAEFVFKTFPESWTSYHTLTTQRKKVSEIRKEADNLIAIGTVGGAVGTITNIGTLSTSLKLAVVLGKGATLIGGGAGVCVLTGYGIKVAVKDLKSKTELVQRVAFKWTDTKKLNYSVRIQCWNEYDGKKISETKTYYSNGSYR